MVARDELQSHLAQRLAAERFRDYGPNGLQVEGRSQVHRLITGVTAGLALIEAAASERADDSEISEPQVHIASETGVAFIACGHQATERFGAPVVGAHVAAQFGLEHRFIDIANPA